MTLAVGGGSGDGWFGAGLVVATVQLVLQVLANLGKAPTGWPWPAIAATTRAGKTAAVVMQAGLVAFCVVGLLTTE